MAETRNFVENNYAEKIDRVKYNVGLHKLTRKRLDRVCPAKLEEYNFGRERQ